MTWIQEKLTDEGFTPVQNKELTGRLEAVFSIQGKSTCSDTWVSMEEICNGEWRIG